MNCSRCGNMLTAQEERYADIAGILDFYLCTPCKNSEVVGTPQGPRYKCALCKSYFPHSDVAYLQGDFGYTRLCLPCFDKPEAQCFLPYMERLARGLLSNDEIRNWNAIHDM